MAHPTQQEIDEISPIFHEEMLLHTLHPGELELWDEWLLKYFHKDVWGIHAHYNWYPVSHRAKDHEDPVYTMKELHG